ncbi:MAG: HlyD family secretion protein [Geminicoccaceae bacterium]|nr:HlyD family secretion protein [Geminicoccaceae bacterium]
MSAVVKRMEPDTARKNSDDAPKDSPQASPLPETPAGRGTEAPERPVRRKGRRIFWMLFVPALLVAGGTYVWLAGGRFESTENANLQAAMIAVSSQVAGRAEDVRVRDNVIVKAGDVLFQVDPEPYAIAVAHANASLSAARIEVRRLQSGYRLAMAQSQIASDNLAYFQQQFDRQRELRSRGVASVSSYDGAVRDLRNAEDTKVAADEAIANAKAALGGLPVGGGEKVVDDHPTVRAAQAVADKAAYDLENTMVRAPSDGILAKASSFREGTYVTPSAPLFALVETGELWVDANFKETQLTNMKVGQKATVVFDAFPDREFEATVDSIGAGTGAEFSLLPAQNATGNWVKVTQRVPVRVHLEATPAETAMLVNGMSADVTVDTGVERTLRDLLRHLDPF